VYYGAVENLMTKVYLGPMGVLWPPRGSRICWLGVPWDWWLRCTMAQGCTVALQMCTVAPVWRICGRTNDYILPALLHGTLVVGISQTSRRWTEGATHIRQGDHHVGHWPTF